MCNKKLFEYDGKNSDDFFGIVTGLFYEFCLYLKLREVEKLLNKENIWFTYNSVRSGLSQFQIK